MRYCVHCGSPIPDDALFCPKCGIKTDAGFRMDPGQPGMEGFRPEDWTAQIPEDRKKRKWLIPVVCVLLAAAILITAIQLPSLVRKIRHLLPLGEVPGILTPAPSLEPVPTPDFAGTPEQPGTPVEVPHLEQRLYLQMLSAEEMDNFQALYRSVMTCEEECVLPHAVSPEKVSELYSLLYCECPEAIHLALDGSQRITYSSDESRVTVHLTYTMDKAEFRAYTRACKSLLERWKEKTEDMTDWEKEMYVYEQLARGCKYDMDARYAAGAAGAMIEGKAKCDGIAHAMQWAMQEMGIPCGCILGIKEGDTVGHCWNYIILDGVPSELDVTMDVRKPEEKRICLYACVNVSPEQMRAVYHLDSLHDRFMPPAAEGTKPESYHERNGTYFPEGAEWEDRVRELCEAASVHNTSFSIQFETEEDMDAFFEAIPELLQRWAEAGYILSDGWMSWREPLTRTAGITFDPSYLNQ
ncbi:MAG: zinc-ribbon domain-containing protein [Clostridia bacterium]|nr:zinc-ribbon domain-containing protein [Clostridia bacterium]